VKLRVERDVLAEAVTWTARSLPTRPPVPVLAGLLLEARTDGVLVLSGFDYEVSAKVEIPAEVSEAGTALVSGRLLADISRSLPAKPVTFVQDGSKIAVTCGTSRFTLMTMPVDEYPARPAMPSQAGVLSSDVFQSAVAQVTVAASRDETLPILTGVRMEIQDSTVTLLATDRYRLAMRELPWRPAAPGAESVALVRARTLSEVAKSFGAGGEVVLALSGEGANELIGFSSGGRQTTSLLVDGDYPKVRSLFPMESPVHAVVRTAALVEAVRRVALVAERNTPVRMSFSDGQVVLEAGQGEEAQASEAVEASLVGEDLTVAFNPGFLLDGLQALTTDYVRMSFTQPTKPAVLTGQAEVDGPDDLAYRYLIMPVRMAG
jgi:DNA polymerase-3 subunit beta